jgi:chromosome segregation ATPase
MADVAVVLFATIAGGGIGALFCYIYLMALGYKVRFEQNVENLQNLAKGHNDLVKKVGIQNEEIDLLRGGVNRVDDRLTAQIQPELAGLHNLVKSETKDISELRENIAALEKLFTRE